MSAPKHTQGDWGCCDIVNGEIAIYKGSVSIAIITNYSWDRDNPPLEKRKANANLIAAAPEMYEALKLFFIKEDRDLSLTELTKFVMKGKEALAKAKGKEVRSE